ncbi:Kinase [Spironucleus salmonicida]|uniref:Kinase n=1 Tax=Spironucleus salmonicida TaxID=348837 RepID=V6LKQ8_9EUKA|nr:Kinase [Spironucleus salmonicida]|eukprot:EST44948.1 Kinase [Spironucleus salmonicida]
MKNLRSNYLNNKFLLDCIIGSGAMGIVGLFTNTITRQKVAIKQLPAFEVEEIYLQEALKEANVHSQLRHPNIVQIYEYFKIDQYFYIVMEYCNAGNLVTENTRQRFKEMYRYKEIQFKFVDELVYQIVKAVYYLHYQHFLHRDIKPQNILLHVQNGHLSVKLADFGCSKKQKQEYQNTMVGTPEFQSPEQILGQKYTNKIDIWGLGCVIYYLLEGDAPFMNKIHSLQVHFNSSKSCELPKSIQGKFRTLLNNTLIKDQNQRLTALEILQIYYDKRLELHQRPLFQKKIKIGILGQNFINSSYSSNNFCIEFVTVTRTLKDVPLYLICVDDLMLGSFQADYISQTGGNVFCLLDSAQNYDKSQLTEFMSRNDTFITSVYQNFTEHLICRLINTSIRFSKLSKSKVKSTVECFVD